jgi:ankyrin repeat protein
VLLQVVGQSGCMCCTSDITIPGTAAGMTPLMCAAKGAAIDAIRVLVHRGAKVKATDAAGRTALWHAMHLDKRCTLEVAQVLLAAGSMTTMPGKDAKKTGLQITDITGETWVHRAVRYGESSRQCPDPLRAACCTGCFHIFFLAACSS